MKFDISRYAPLGMDMEFERKFFKWGILLSGLYSLKFVLAYQEARRHLYDGWDSYGPIGELHSEICISPFFELVDSCFTGYLILAVCMVLFSIYHYLYHYQGSKSIYLMRRLPNGWELHIRCLAVPIFGVCACFITTILLIGIYYLVYILFTPKQCILSNQWHMFWQYGGGFRCLF